MSNHGDEIGSSDADRPRVDFIKRDETARSPSRQQVSRAGGVHARSAPPPTAVPVRRGLSFAAPQVPRRAGGAVIVAAVAVSLVVVSVVLILLRTGAQDRPSMSGNYGATGVSVMSGPSFTGSRGTSTGPAMPNANDSDATVAAQLRTTAEADRALVRRDLADRWVPQISSKRFGLVAEGITWNHVEILREHVRLRDRYPNVRLLWSGSWSTFGYPDFWITVVGVAFPAPDGALRWCADNGLDADHCYAKLVSETHPIENSTAYQ